MIISAINFCRMLTSQSIISAFHANISAFKKTGIILGIILEKYEHCPVVYSDAIVKSTIQQKPKLCAIGRYNSQQCANNVVFCCVRVAACANGIVTTPNNTQHNATGYANGGNM